MLEEKDMPSSRKILGKIEEALLHILDSVAIGKDSMNVVWQKRIVNEIQAPKE